MARTASKKKSGDAKTRKSSTKRSAGRTRSEAGEAFVALLQSPLVADLVAAAATAALTTLARDGSGTSSGSTGKRAGNAVKRAGKAAADAVKRRLSEEIDEIKKASKAAKGGAKG